MEQNMSKVENKAKCVQGMRSQCRHEYALVHAGA